MSNPIYVTQPSLPPLAEFLPYLEKIWDNKILANGGPYHQQLEQALCDYLGVKHLALFTNVTIALVTALQALRITGEVITTPYSFVATAHSLLWNGIKPMFVDIDPNTLNLGPAKSETAHAFGAKNKIGALFCPNAKTKKFRQRQRHSRHCKRSAAIHTPRGISANM
jgi:dTDP-4-amino-4,6-dideoxygalactose transaminase